MILRASVEKVFLKYFHFDYDITLTIKLIHFAFFNAHPKYFFSELVNSSINVERPSHQHDTLLCNITIETKS